MPALAQTTALAAAAPIKPKPNQKTPGGVTVMVINWREADFVELQAAESGSANWKKVLEGFVTLPCRERKVSAAQELLGRCDCGPPRGHRSTAKRAVRLGGDEMALDVEGVVDGGVG